MVDCPRCGSAAARLVSLPPEAMEAPVLEGGGTEELHGQVCQWCRHEVMEG